MSYFSSVYNELLKECQIAVKLKPIPAAAVCEDADDVYHRFGGAAIAEMLKDTYNKTKTSSKDNNQISLDILLLQKLSVHTEEQKYHIPA